MHWLSPLEIRLAYRRARRKQFAAGVGPGHLPATLTAAEELVIREGIIDALNVGVVGR